MGAPIPSKLPGALAQRCASVDTGHGSQPKVATRGFLEGSDRGGNLFLGGRGKGASVIPDTARGWCGGVGKNPGQAVNRHSKAEDPNLP